MSLKSDWSKSDLCYSFILELSFMAFAARSKLISLSFQLHLKLCFAFILHVRRLNPVYKQICKFAKSLQDAFIFCVLVAVMNFSPTILFQVHFCRVLMLTFNHSTQSKR